MTPVGGKPRATMAALAAGSTSGSPTIAQVLQSAAALGGKPATIGGKPIIISGKPAMLSGKPIQIGEKTFLPPHPQFVQKIQKTRAL